MKKIVIALILFCAIVPALAQENAGICFEESANWPQLLAKARAEHKYIFVDCYATWCGPCKDMDKQVYPLKTVGEAFNPKFIAVRVQMDKTPKDSKVIQDWYATADMLKNNYSVSYFPTFLFFDPDGNAVHKISGSQSVEEFIRLANDVQDPEKQSYNLSKNFRPGRLDTAEEKKLALSFFSSDRELAEKLAVDYLSRIPTAHLGTAQNKILMRKFSGNPEVVDRAVAYINTLNKDAFNRLDNAEFIEDMSNQDKVLKLSVDHIGKLSKQEITQPANLKFIQWFDNNPQVQQIVADYLGQLPEEQLYTKENIELAAAFSKSTSDQGFDLFYRHTNRVDFIMSNKDYAESMSEDMINRTEFAPLIEAAKGPEITPDFKKLFTTISGKYGEFYAKRIIPKAEYRWYFYLVLTKKESQYWPQLLDMTIQNVEKIKPEDRTTFSINNYCYGFFFLHCDNKSQLDTAVSWMKNIIEKNPNNATCLDTYACLLFKSGDTDEAVQYEEKARLAAIKTNHQKDADQFRVKIDKMKKGERIWEEKEFQ